MRRQRLHEVGPPHLEHVIDEVLDFVRPADRQMPLENDPIKTGQECGKFLWRFLGSLVKIGKVDLNVIQEDLVMEPMPKMSRDEYLAVMRQKMESMLDQVADAINNAPDGYIIAGSEEKVRDLFADVRQQAFELGLQMRVDAAEAAFSPSEALPDRQEPSR
jgi:hypothetical protein